ncbi:MAG: hypothetical protein AAFX06_21930 [Planctomycetota bacterium]
MDYLRSSSNGQSRATNKVDILSLDLNLRDNEGHGLDVVKTAVENGQKFATIAISACADDDELRAQLTEKEYLELQSLRPKVEAISHCPCIVEPKLSTERFGDASMQVPRIEANLISRSPGNPLRELAKKLRESVADLNGKFFCMHFELPEIHFRPCSGEWVAASARMERSRLNKLGVWKSVFHPLDEYSSQLDIVARLLFLTKPKSFFAGLSLQETIEKPLPKKQWLCPQPLVKNLTKGQAFLLLQLIAQNWAAQSHSGGTTPVRSLEDAIATPQVDVSGIEICGLREPTVLGWKGNRSVHSNGESLSVDRYVDGKEDGTLKTSKSRLETSIKGMLGDVEYDVIECLENTYNLMRPGQVFIHLKKE